MYKLLAPAIFRSKLILSILIFQFILFCVFPFADWYHWIIFVINQVNEALINIFLIIRITIGKITALLEMELIDWFV